MVFARYPVYCLQSPSLLGEDNSQLKKVMERGIQHFLYASLCRLFQLAVVFPEEGSSTCGAKCLKASWLGLSVLIFPVVAVGLPLVFQENADM